MQKNTLKEVLTFVGKSFATPGFRFFFSHVPKSCTEKCALFNTCQKNLVPGNVYRIVEVQNKVFQCPFDLHEEAMVLSKLVEEPIYFSIPTRNVMEGGSIKVQIEKCPHIECKYHEFCVPEFRVREGEKVKILEAKEKIKDCQLGKNLTVVRVQQVKE